MFRKGCVFCLCLLFFSTLFFCLFGLNVFNCRFCLCLAISQVLFLFVGLKWFVFLLFAFGGVSTLLFSLLVCFLKCVLLFVCVWFSPSVTFVCVF